MKERIKPAEVVSLNLLGLKIELKNPGLISIIILLIMLCFLIVLVWLFNGQPGIIGNFFKMLK